MSKTIELSRGKVAIVDDKDHEWLSEFFRWYYVPGTSTGYAATAGYNKAGKRATILMHRLILATEDDVEGRRISHINKDGLDNRRSNLLILPGERSAKVIMALAEYEGISYRKGGPWVAEVMAHGVPHYLGNFATAEAANRARQEALSGNIAE